MHGLKINGALDLYCQLTIFRNHWGWVIDAINSASHFLNFTYTIQNPNPLSRGYNKDGSYRGTVGIAMNHIVDFSTGATPIESANSKVILPLLLPRYLNRCNCFSNW